MLFEEWAGISERICNKFLQQDHISIEYLLKLMSTFHDLYACIFTNKKIVQKLYDDVRKGIDTTRKGMVRLNCQSDKIDDLLQKELAFHGHDRSKCKNRETSVILAVLWLDRVIWFVLTIMQFMLKKELDENIVRKAYDMTLRRYHSWTSEQAISVVFALFNGNDGIRNISKKIDIVRNITKLLTKVHLKIHKIIRQLDVDFADKM